MTTKKLLAPLSITILVLVNTVAQADSTKLINSGNGHIYQRFDTGLDWNSAKATCNSLGGYLATITSQSENDWVTTTMTNGANTSISIWIGGTDAAQEGVWTWITGEQWDYANWAPGEPNNFGGNENNLELDMGHAWALNDYNGAGVKPYICEWPYSQYLDVTAIPDVNKDGRIDNALLVLKAGNYYLNIIDGANGKLLKQVLLGASTQITPIALTLVDDANRNGYKEISILYTKMSTGSSALQLRDSSTAALVNTLNLPK